MKFRYLFAAFLVGCIMMTGCKKETVVEEQDQLPEGAIILNSEKPHTDSKTYVEGNTVEWVIGDEVFLSQNGSDASSYTVYYNNTLNQYYLLHSQALVGSGNRLIGGWGAPIYGYYGCSDVSVNDNHAPNSVTIPDSYTCRFSGTKQIMPLPMVTYYNQAYNMEYGNTITFKHVTAAVNVNVRNQMGSGIVVDRVTVSSSNYKLSGETTISGYENSEFLNYIPTVPAESGSGSVTVTITDGLAIANGETKAIQVPIRPVGSNGVITVTVYAHDASAPSKSYEIPITHTFSEDGLPRNNMVSANCLFSDESLLKKTPLTFEAYDVASTVYIDYGSAIVQHFNYRTFNAATSTWTNWTGYVPQAINLNPGDKVQFWNSYQNGAIKKTFAVTGKCYIYGNIMSLLYNNFANATEFLMTESFSALFKDCTTINIHPDKDLLLPTYTAVGCYYQMFSGCTNLTKAPALPSTSAAGACYKEMFKGCTSLTTPPALPAETLLPNCYESMFEGCTSLASAPALPATELADYCYMNMFKGCTSLQTAPDLLATALYPHQGCYNGMFDGCSSLNYVKCLAKNGIHYYSDGKSRHYTTENWLNGVAANGTFVRHSWTTVSQDENSFGITWPRSANGIPSGWTVQTATN